MSDRTLTCRDCGQAFTFTAGEQAFYAERGFSEPQRCPSCRSARKAQRASQGFDSGYSGGCGGYSSGGYGGGGLPYASEVLQLWGGELSHASARSRDIPSSSER
jgi:hypothetical protein